MIIDLHQIKMEIMEATYNYKLIEGVFKPSEAQRMLLDLINAKINYHNLDSFSNHIRFNTEFSSSKIRIEELAKTSESIKELIELANNNNMQLIIKSEITIELINPLK